MAIAKITAKVVKRINHKLMDRLTMTNENLQRVKVGVPAGRTESDGTSIALIARVHEFGAPSVGIPERPFLRNTIMANLEKYKRLNRINIIKYFQGTITMEQALGQLGLMAAADVKQFIHNNSYQLKPATIAAKGSSRALVDTGQLVQSILYEIERGGSGD